MKLFLLLLISHWIADFLFQTNWMATGKSKNIAPLMAHCILYSFIMAFSLFLVCELFWYPFLIFFISHFVIDGITSKVNSWLWNNKKIHWFFTSIGFDQLIHFGVIYFVLQI